MKGAGIRIDRLAGRPAAALIVDGALDDLLIDPTGDAPRPGAVFRARADRPMKGLGGWMLSLPGGTGFCRHGDDLVQGAPVLVQVTGYAEPGKAVPVTTRLMFKSRYCIVTPGAPGVNLSRAIRDDAARARLHALLGGIDLPETPGVILRSAAGTEENAALILDDIEGTLDLARTVTADRDGPPELLLDGLAPDLLAWRDWAHVPCDAVVDMPGCFLRDGVQDEIDGLASPRVELPGGAHMFVEPTRALVAVDVNTGRDTGPAAGLKANIAAVRALPRALRLRGLGGQVAVDLAPMPKKDRRGLEQALRAAFRACPVETAFVGWTPLGHMELSRARARPVLEHALK